VVGSAILRVEVISNPQSQYKINYVAYTVDIAQASKAANTLELLFYF
jgi:hypothetical protein